MRISPSLAPNVLECFISVELLGTASLVGIGAFGYVGSHRAFSDRKAVLVQNTGGRIELAALASIGSVSTPWRKFDQIVIHSPARYLLARLEMAKRDAPHSIGWRLIASLGGPEIAIITDEIADPMTPRMEEAVALAKSGRATTEITLDDA